MNETNDEGPTELGGVLNNVINVDEPSVGVGDCGPNGEASGEGTQTEGSCNTPFTQIHNINI